MPTDSPQGPHLSLDLQRAHGTGERRTGFAALPVELLHLICRQLCLCSYCDPDPEGLDIPHSPVIFRNDLDSLSRTCRTLRQVAQPYIFHAFGYYDSHFALRLYFKFTIQLAHIADQVRRVTLNSIWGDLVLLSHLTGLHILRVLAFSPGTIGFTSHMSFPSLKEFCYGPCLVKSSVVELQDARKDLRAVLGAAERLSRLTCHRLFHDINMTPFIFLRLPSCKISILELHQCWLPHGTFRRFVANFPCLKKFRFRSTARLRYETGEHRRLPEDGPGRLADALDGKSINILQAEI